MTYFLLFTFAYLSESWKKLFGLILLSQRKIRKITRAIVAGKTGHRPSAVTEHSTVEVLYGLYLPTVILTIILFHHPLTLSFQA